MVPFDLTVRPLLLHCIVQLRVLPFLFVMGLSQLFRCDACRIVCSILSASLAVMQR